MRHSAKLVTAGVISAVLVAGSAVIASGATDSHATRPSATYPHGAPGVTATKVNVGAIVSQSGPLAADFAPYLSGVRAYFDYVNAERRRQRAPGRPRLRPRRQPRTRPPTSPMPRRSSTRTRSSPSSASRCRSSTPTSSSRRPRRRSSGTRPATCGRGPKNFFADYGSVLNYNSSIPFFAYVAKETKSTKIAVVALNYPSSQDECKGAMAGFKKYKFKVVYSNINESIGANWSIEAKKIQRRPCEHTS